MKSTAKIRLIHLVLDMDIGGLQRLITQMTLAMDPNLFDVQIICMNHEGCFARQLRTEGFKVTLLQKNQDRADLWYPIRLARHLRKLRPDVLHTHAGTFIFGALAGTIARTPAIVYTEHGRDVIDHPVRQAEDRIAAKLCDSIVPVSDNLKDVLVDRIKAPHRKMVTIINGIATDLFLPTARPVALQKEFAIPDGCLVIGTVARLDGIKDQLSMIKAFEITSKEITNSRLILVGDGPMRGELQAYIDSQGLHQKIFITGPRNDVPDFLNLFDLFILSSLSEGTSMSLLEAMASGVPAVVTNVGGNPAIVTHETDGLVVEPGDPKLLAESILRLLSDNNLRSTFAERCTAKIKRDYSITTMTNNYCNLYLKILHSKKRFEDVQL